MTRLRDEPAYRILDVPLVGVTAETAQKLLLSVGLITVVALLHRVVGAVIDRLTVHRGLLHARFWSRQGLALASAAALVIGLLSLWFDDPTRLATALGLITAGLAFALQKVVTAMAGYLVILRGRTFGIGDRIVMGGVRGDVVDLGFTQTVIMEMGEPPAVQAADPAMWIRSRQYTGRIVAVSNACVFDDPVYNYTRDFPYLWEELRLPIRYDADRVAAERILLASVTRHASEIASMSSEDRAELARRYLLDPPDTSPRVYYRLTDNWLELTVRFVAREHGVRELKDAISRDLLAALEGAGIGLASQTYEVVGLPAVRLDVRRPD